MNVRELDYGELLQLKEELCYGTDMLPEMTEKQEKICNEAICADEIPDELVFELYDGINFVKEDFWVNLPSCEVVDKHTDVVEKQPKVIAELPICFVNMIAACLTTIQEHDLLDLVYGKFASVDEKETARDDLEFVLREFCDVLQELDEDTVIVKK